MQGCAKKTKSKDMKFTHTYVLTIEPNTVGGRLDKVMFVKLAVSCN